MRLREVYGLDNWRIERRTMAKMLRRFHLQQHFSSIKDESMDSSRRFRLFSRSLGFVLVIGSYVFVKKKMVDISSYSGLAPGVAAYFLVSYFSKTVVHRKPRRCQCYPFCNPPA